ncbi:hypothetical protein HMPREF1219_00152 [Corynebacterium pyruviciproducens ATCC BAA-1742]|uniref:Uncharacterized protein n=1 Tax=Corynebacterium pyruviciproducens ATCC BAA-1742 TaxID=1125779 RepID=S2ZLI5_9CORY|nr:hypothetical protein [Corynebacterium pyruviciproducens]EPD70857.1 hypothetical protein HMPREF1219_00152 [Corynebacterium pyruviciproducens ATCC BAA-1742]
MTQDITISAAADAAIQSLRTSGVKLSAAQLRNILESIEATVDNHQPHAREKKKTHARFNRAGTARQSLAGFDHGVDILGLTYGQFSLIDIIQTVLEKTGPADVVIATWSAGFYDLAAAEHFRDCGLIRSIKFVLDSGRAKRGQAGVHDVRDIFGEDCFIQIRTHAKFVVIQNEDWNVCITSSMNLNKNIRCEQFELTDDRERCEMLLDFVEAGFRECPPSRSFGRTMPGLETVDPARAVVAAPDVHRFTGKIPMGSIELDAG